MWKGLIGLTAALVLVLAPAAARAGDSQIQAKLRLTSPKPNTAAGAILNLVRPDGANGKPKTEAVGIFQLPPGTVINQNAVPPCTKDDATWQVEGPDACPASYIGNGFATLYTGLGAPIDPIGIDEQWYYAPGQIVALYTLHGQRSPVLEIGHVQIRGATFVAPLDLPPGYPPGSKTSPKETDVTLNTYVGPRGAFITTPPTCPPDRKWTTTVTLHYDDGTTDTVTDATPCERGQPQRRHHRASRSRRRHHSGRGTPG
jgi:hypothetical protein